MDDMKRVEKECRQLGAAAERCAGKLRAMDWKEWQRMLLGLAHAAMILNEVRENAEKIGGEHSNGIALTAGADAEAIMEALDLLGWTMDDGETVS